ncbi:uncharacterized protein CANTADRAFT_277241 [Suhomyces tanzawaensis NRRL Y-17324]|uniref:Uncharacterized protein n=1 Tax=Suhomyces tanzawaensis NRRL Y-17324 TaxID=984487 RepID=A0A1E4SH24_9ASCO|nr:uncharacterized protein CANTADRAFT_277241 [Suhomyces tanzawaensis NRRL Y-17324]ODV78813.1 hypothetical protein CANTADRAFT_277241 [Suhomyces tanzawaensis NRRL Y-17324]
MCPCFSLLVVSSLSPCLHYAVAFLPILAFLLPIHVSPLFHTCPCLASTCSTLSSTQFARFVAHSSTPCCHCINGIFWIGINSWHRSWGCRSPRPGSPKRAVASASARIEAATSASRGWASLTCRHALADMPRWYSSHAMRHRSKLENSTFHHFTRGVNPTSESSWCHFTKIAH